MEKENQRVIITKKLLKESLLNILRKKNISEITVTELCKASGINRATFYRHYNVPGDVLLEIEQELSQNIVFETVPQTADDFENYILMVCEYIYTNKEFVSILMKNKTYENFTQLIKDFYKGIIKYKNQAKGLKNMDEENLKLLSAFLAGGGYYLFKTWIIDGVNKTPDEMAKLIMILINKMI